MLKPPNFIGICSTDFFMFYQYNMALQFLEQHKRTYIGNELYYY